MVASNVYSYAGSNPTTYIDPFGLEVWGFNVGFGGAYTIRTGYSLQFVFDSQGNFAIQRTREIGRGFGKSAGVFGSVLIGGTESVYGLEKWGVPLSGSGRFGYAAINIPIDYDVRRDDCGNLETFEAGMSGTVVELGISRTLVGGAEGGVTATYTDTLIKTSILGDIGRSIGSTAYHITHW